MRRTALMLCVAALAGCEESTMVGSGCPNGACPEALVRDDDVCVVRTDVAQIAFDGDPQVSDIVLCLPAPLERSEEGTIRGSVYFTIGSDADPQLDCTDRAFLKPVTAAVHEALVPGNDPDAKVCELVQLPVVAGDDGGAPIVGAGDGFYYDDFSEAVETACGEAAGRIVFTHDALPWDGVVARLASAEVRNADGEIDATLSCEPLRGTEPIGSACSLPQAEYVDSQVIVATRSDDCGQGVCIAYHLQGRVGGDCTEPTVDPDGSVSWNPNEPVCASPEEVDQRMYCTCRCDGPPGATDLCDCPDGFSCVDAVAAIAPSAAGAYCVKNSGFVD